jgi:hypothetical protein
MPVVPVMPVPAPVRPIDHMADMGRMGEGAAAHGRGHARRAAGKTETRSHQPGDEDCTHFILLVPREATDAPLML